MILVDVNLLLYAHNPRAVDHAAARAWFESTLGGSALVRFAWMTLWAFVRITTNSRAFERPTSTAQAAERVASWLARPACGMLDPGERHWDILTDLLRSGQVSGPLVTDAVLAAIAIEHGAVLYTTDRDFARFPGLRFVNPLQ